MRQFWGRFCPVISHRTLAVCGFVGLYAGCSGNLGENTGNTRSDRDPTRQSRGTTDVPRNTGGTGGGSGSAGNGSLPSAGNGGGTDPATPPPPGTEGRACVDRRGKMGWALGPQTGYQLRTVVRQVFGDAVADDPQTQSLMANFPDDLRAKHFDTEERQVSRQYQEANVALTRHLVGLAVSNEDTRKAIESFAGKSCDASMDLGADCGRDLARKFAGAMSHVRLADADRDELLERFQTNKDDVGVEKAYGGLIASTLLSPRSALRLENVTGTGDDPRESVDAHALGTRLALTLTGGLPDERLRAAMADESILKTETLREEANRLMESPMGRKALRHFAQQWLNVSLAKAPAPDDRFVDSDAESDRVAYEATEEVGRLFEETVLSGGTLYDFFTTDKVAPSNPWLADVYGVEESDGFVSASSPSEKASSPEPGFISTAISPTGCHWPAVATACS